MKAIASVWLTVLLVIGIGVSAGLAQDPSLILYLPLDENQGEVALDLSQYHNDATLKGGPTWTVGKAESALQFGTGKYLQVADADSLDLTDSLTISCWVKILGLTGDHQSGIEKGSGWVAGEYNLVPVYGAAVLLQMFDLPDGCDDEAATGAVADGEWHFVAGTWDGQKIRIYIDAQLSNELGCKGVLIPNADPLYIGARGGSSRWTDGLYDEIKIFNRALTQDELQADMDNPGVSLAVSRSGKVAITWAEIREML